MITKAEKRKVIEALEADKIHYKFRFLIKDAMQLINDSGIKKEDKEKIITLLTLSKDLSIKADSLIDRKITSVKNQGTID